MSSPKNPVLPLCPPAKRGLVVVLYVLMAGLAFWRLALVVFISSKGQSLVHQYLPSVDQFTGWVLLVILTLCHGARQGLRAERQARVAVLGVALGSGAMAIATLAEQFSGGATGAVAAYAGRVGDVVLTLMVLAVVIQELKAVATDRVTIIHLWRFVAVQWLLAWLGALMYYRFHFDPFARARAVEMRETVFLLAAVGLLPNVLMLGGVMWWNYLLSGRASEKMVVPRVRAWVVAIVATNVGGVLMVLNGPALLAGMGCAFLLLGSFMYLVGFPSGSGLGMGGAAAAWGSWILGVWLLASGRILGASNGFYAEGWRALLAGSVALWVVAMGATGLRALSRRPMGDQRLTRVVFWAVLLGVALVPSGLIWRGIGGEDGVSDGFGSTFLQVGVCLSLLGLLIGGIGVMRLFQKDS